jgi:NAD(P)-dependent dehydrogenase (short-subunit alcohol dehydrogenase family)
MKIENGRVAVVTGAASGIGLAIAGHLAAEGVRVVLTDRDGDAVGAAADAVLAAGGDVDALTVDVTDPDAVDRAAAHVMSRFGGLHIAVNNAGIVNGGNSWELSLEDWHRVLDVNLWGVGPYTVAKHGVLGLSDVLRAELADLGAPVGVSVVMPGMIRTGMNPIGSIEPSVVAVNVLDAIRRQRPYVFTDDHAADAVDARLRALLAARKDVLTG